MGEPLTKLARCLAALGLLATATTGCGDGPICPGDLYVSVISPGDGAILSNDGDPNTPGFQVDVRVRTNFRQGDDFTLTIADSSGATLGTSQAVSDSAGNVRFENVTLPPGLITLTATGDSDKCGRASHTITVEVVGAAQCAVSFREQPLENEYYAPLRVLNTTNDTDPDLPGFQANIDIVANAGSSVELFVLDVDAASEASAGTAVADSNGSASFAITLGQGRQAVRAVCGSGASPTQTVFVDTEAPTCAITAPDPAITIIPTMDEDGSADGIQVTVTGQAGGGDVAGEPASFSLGGAALDTGAIGANGEATAVATFGSPGSVDLTFGATDHAGNTCTTTESYEVALEGCSIEITQPSAVVTSDSNDSVAGLQTNLVVQVGAACEGRTVTTNCSSTGELQATVPAGGETTIEITLAANASSMGTRSCRAEVSSPANIVTFDDVTLEWDTEAPAVAYQFLNPADIGCGDAITPADDIDGSTDGVQIEVRVIAPLAASRWVTVTNNGSTETFTSPVPSGEVIITVEPGQNTLVFYAQDIHGNVGASTACPLAVYDLVVAFSPPIADGLVGASDGVVSNNSLTLDLCGTVSATGATVDVSVDGGAPQPATVTGNNWCLNGVTLAASPPAHTIEVEATADQSAGANSLSLVVDLTAPDQPTALTASAPTRQSIRLEWTAPTDGTGAAASYIVKYHTAALTNANFDNVGTEAAGAPTPAAPGTTQNFTIDPLRTGTAYYVAIAAVDAAGNRSTIAAAGPITPVFDSTGPILPPDPDGGDNSLGYAVAYGMFNDDEYSDVAVSAPFNGAGLVYVYFGSADGIGTVPDVVITGPSASSQFGNALTAMRWDTDAYDDLVVGAPFASSFNGRVYVFRGGPNFANIGSAADATAEIGAGGGWFATGYMGWSLATARFDNDSRDDLVIGIPGGGGGNGGVAVVYGGTATGSPILLNDTDASQMNDAVVRLIADPLTALFDLFGQWVHNLGRTEGAGDTTDDIGIAYFESQTVWVYRGQTSKPATAGVHLRPYSATTDLRINGGSSDTTAHFGSAMGSIADLNGDGARDIVIGAYREGPNNEGRVVIVDGNAVGTQTLTGSFLITDIQADGVRFFGTSIVNTARGLSPDIDGDGSEDLVITAGLSPRILVWFGGSIPTGSTTSATYHHRRVSPAIFNTSVPDIGGTPVIAKVVGDVNDDGLEDICLTSWWANSRDGVFEVLWDDGE